MRLRTQGLLFVFCLLALELPLIAILIFQVHAAELEALQEERSSQILARIDQFAASVIHASDRIRNITPDNISVFSDYRKDRDDALSSLTWIKEAIPDRTEQMVLLAGLETTVNYMFGIVDKVAGSIEPLPPNDRVAVVLRFNEIYREKLSKASRKFAADFLELQNQEKEYVERTSPARQKRQREAIMRLLAAGLIGNIIFAIASAVLFTRGITSRLAVLMDNTRRLAGGFSLNPALEGSDEIAKLDQAFHKMADDLENAQRARQSMVAIVSHELRTPLNAVSAFLQVFNLDGYGPIPELSRTPAEAAHRDARKLIGLINNLLDMEKLAAGKMSMDRRPFYLDEVFERAQEDTRSLAVDRGLQISFGESNAELLADPDRLTQVLVNLINHACRSSPPGEAVIVEAAESPQYVEIRVIFQGRWTTESDLETLFDRFTNSSGREGQAEAGLELPISKAIVEQMGGQIGVTVQPENGRILWVRLPVQVGSAIPE